jgi:hypothetical protein
MGKGKASRLLTVREVAERLGAASSSVRAWCLEGRFVGARLEQSPTGAVYWLIPESALKDFVKRPRGGQRGSKRRKKSQLKGKR